MLKMNFFEELLKCTDGDVAWIAPRIRTLSGGIDRNPQMLSRPTRRKIDMLRLFYRFPVLFSFYSYCFECRSKGEQNAQYFSKMCIYAGHGSIMIFTHLFIQKNFPFEFPAFMYGEELYFAEIARKSNLKVMYEPNVEVENVGNVSTKPLGNKWRCKMSYDALTKLRRYFE